MLLGFKAGADFIGKLWTWTTCTCTWMYYVPKVPMHDFAKWYICILGFGLPSLKLMAIHCQRKVGNWSNSS